MLYGDFDAKALKNSSHILKDIPRFFFRYKSVVDCKSHLQVDDAAKDIPRGVIMLTQIFMRHNEKFGKKCHLNLSLGALETSQTWF